MPGAGYCLPDYRLTALTLMNNGTSYAEQERLLEWSPVAHVRRPSLDHESHATGLEQRVGALLVAAGLASAREHALVSLLASNGLRVSEALSADIEALGIERGHRTLTVLRKGGKVVAIPLAPRTARAGAGVPRPARHLRRGRLPRRSCPVALGDSGADRLRGAAAEIRPGRRDLSPLTSDLS